MLAVSPQAAASTGTALANEVAPRAYLPFLAREHGMDVAFTAYIGGRSEIAAAQGDLIVFGNGPSLLAYDQSGPGAPVLIGQSELLTEDVIDVALDGQLAFAIHRSDVSVFRGAQEFSLPRGHQPSRVQPGRVRRPRLCRSLPRTLHR